MNTFAEDTEEMKLAISEALADGVNVKMLLMHPSDPALIHRHSELPPNYGTLDTFLFKWLIDATGLCEKCADVGSGGDRGEWQIKFYRNTANYPIVAMSNEAGQLDEVFTGFYGAYSSERTPYVEWRGGKESLLNYFMQIFHQKWEHKDSLQSNEALVS